MTARGPGNESIYLLRASEALLRNGLDRPENFYGRYGFASFPASPCLLSGMEPDFPVPSLACRVVVVVESSPGRNYIHSPPSPHVWPAGICKGEGGGYILKPPAGFF